MPDDQAIYEQYKRSLKPDLLKKSLAKMDWHWRSTDDYWIEETVERIGCNGRGEHQFPGEFHGSYAQGIGGDGGAGRGKCVAL